MGRAMLSKSLIQFSVEGWGCVPSLLFDLRPNYGGGNEDSDDPLQKVPCTHCHIQCPDPAADHQRLLDTHGQVVGSLLLSPGSWCTQGSVCARQESISQSCVSSSSSMVGLMATSSKRAYAILRSAAPRALTPVAGHC